MEYIKRRTLELYDSLPDDEEGRKARKDVRDEVIKLNYAFFGYVASHTFINDPQVTYEDKLQSALLHFAECWWWFKWNGYEEHKGYRQDLSFTVFFKPRIGEMIERELNIVKYSVRRSLCMEVGKQLGKHWAKVTYDDLSDPRLNLPADKMNALKFIFGAMYPADLDEYQMYIPEKSSEYTSELCDQLYSDEYDTVEELLMHEMVESESKISDNKLKEMSKIYDIDLATLKAARAVAEQNLYEKLKEISDNNIFKEEQ